MTKKYVLYWCEGLRDGIEEGAKVVSSVKEGVELAEKITNGFAGCNTNVKLFELGKEIPLLKFEEEEPQPSRKKTKFKVK